VEKDLSPLGTVYVAREAWTARLAGAGSAPRGTVIKVVRKEGLVLVSSQWRRDRGGRIAGDKLTGPHGGRPLEPPFGAAMLLEVSGWIRPGHRFF